MVFKVATIFKAVDGDPEVHRSILKTTNIEIYTVITELSNMNQVISTCQELVIKEGVQSVILTPDFTHQEVAEISTAIDGKAGVFVARSDIPSTLFTQHLLLQGGWFPM